MKVLRLVLISTLAGCAVPGPTPQELQNADYGTDVGDYQNIIKNYMVRVLKDPDSARYDFVRSPAKAWYGNPRIYGYAACADINAKNGYGGYTGGQRSYFLIRNGQVVIAHHAGDLGDIFIRELCSRF